jgi:class 3 adenylate cyclase/tetratricopeptide (TPR) repeat protein
LTDSAHNKIKAFLKKGRYLAAYNLAGKTLQLDPENVNIKQQYGLALAKLGLLERAKSWLWDLYQNYSDDPETAGILGSVLKSIYKKDKNWDDAVHSRNIYLENYKHNKSFYTGINAASMSVVIGDQKMAALIAREITGEIESESQDFWELVTLGEAFLLLGNQESAINAYKKARNTIEKDHGMFNSVYGQFILLSDHIKVPIELVKLFKPPSVIVFTGHMIDHPDRSEPRFPESISAQIAEEIAKALDKLDAGIGYSSLACGADILFVEEMIRRNAEVNLFLPYNMSDFVKSSINFAGPEWLKKFNRILENHSVNYITEEGYFGNDDLHALLGSVIFGKSILRAESFGIEPALLTVLKASENKGGILMGGTEYLVEKWPFKNNVHSIDPAQFVNQSQKPFTKRKVKHTESPGKVQNRKIRHILFADVVGYSKFSEDKTPLFVENLLQDISKNIRDLSHQPEILNTWGDSIFAVYSNIEEMMEFATALQKTLIDSSWDNMVDDNSQVSMRIALHTGPVFLLDDPLTRRKNAFGNHINRAARMEPVTMPGNIYASDQFASVLKIECYKIYDFEYVGIVDLPKEFGKQEMYRINVPSG